MDTIVVIGASGLIGSRVVDELRRRGHDVVAASRSLGIDTVTGEGLDGALAGASTVIDVTNPGGAAWADALAFFSASTRNLLAAEARAGARHHVVLSIVGTDRLAAASDVATDGAGYFPGKRAQEELATASTIPSTIVRATQFYEFVAGIADASTVDGVVRVPPIRFQPVAADDVVQAVVDAALAEPADATIDVAGPERSTLEAVVGRVLAAAGDHRPVVADPAATYFGVPVDAEALVPRGDARLGAVTLDAWLSRPGS